MCGCLGGVHGCQGEGGVHGCQGHAWLLGVTWLPGGHAWLLGGMHDCWGTCVAARGVNGCWGACMVAGGMHGCWGMGHVWWSGVCMAKGEACVAKRGHAWDMTRYGDTINERAVRHSTGMHSCLLKN